MISGATQSSFKFLFEHFTVPENVIIHFNPNELLSSNKNIKILWAHYNCDQPLYQNVNWDDITHIVCVSEWEKEQFIKHLKIKEEKISVIRNGGADYFQPSKNKSKTLIYTSTPYRGLEYLPYIFTKVLSKHPDAKLKVFSGMELYGLPDNYDELYSILKNIPNVEVYKPIEHEKLVEHYQDAAIFCYPNIWEETSCVSLIEAMRCGCYPILSNIGALRETSMGFGSLIKMYGTNVSSGWKPTKEFFDEFANEVIRILDDYKYDENISNFACNYYDWKIIAEKWVKLVDRLLQKEKNMSYDITELVEMPTSEIVSDSEVLKKVYEDVFKWEGYDKEHAQGRTNFQIEKFIALDNFTIASSFTALLKNRRIMAEGLFSKIIEMKEKQREFDMKWENTPKDKPLKNGESCSWYDLDSLRMENYLRSSELEIRDRAQQISFFDELLNKLIEMNGGPITKEQFDQEDHIYWERRFANQAYDELLSQQTGISVGNLHSIRRATAPTLVSNDLNRIKNSFPELSKLMSSDKDKEEFILGLQKKVVEGIGEVTGIDMKKLANENVSDRISLPNKTEESQTLSPKSLFNSQYVSK
jgi:glycosyltransferase involved in cell wall biosynthesis